MFRASSMAKDSAPVESVFERLYDLPMVKDSVTKLGQVYNETKTYNVLVKLTLETAECSMGLVLHTARPVVKAFEKPLGVLNSIACSQLEKLEKSYPIITEPSDEVMKRSKATYVNRVHPLVEQMKPMTDRAICLAKCSYDKTMQLKEYSENQVRLLVVYTVQKYNGAKTQAVEKMAALCDVTSRKISEILGKDGTAYVMANLNLILSLVDKYLPPGEEATSEENPSDGDRMLEKVWEILSKVTFRTYRYLRQDFLTACRATVCKLSPSELGSRVCFIMCGLKNRVLYVYDEAMGSNAETENKESECVLTVYEMRFITMVRRSRRLVVIIRESVNSTLEKIYVPLAAPHESLQKLIVSPRTYIAQPILDQLEKMKSMKQFADLEAYLRYYYDIAISYVPTRFISSGPKPLTEKKAPEQDGAQKEEGDKEEKSDEKDDSFHSTGKTSAPSSGHNSDHDHQDE